MKGSLQACRFIRSEEDDGEDTWEVRLAKQYYQKLYREYAIVDLSRHKACRPCAVSWICLLLCDSSSKCLCTLTVCRQLQNSKQMCTVLASPTVPIL